MNENIYIYTQKYISIQLILGKEKPKSKNKQKMTKNT